MDFFDSRNYRINKILLSIIGQWPFQSPRTSHTIVIIFVLIVCSQLFVKLCGMFSYIYDLDTVIECLIPILIDISGLTKIMNSILYANEIRGLFDQIRDDFLSLRNSSDIEILRKYADNGRRLSTIYVCLLYMVIVIFLLLPLKPLIFHGANTTTRPLLLHKVKYYYIDIDKYYFLIWIHGYLASLICGTWIIAADATFMIFVQHACGLFIVTTVRIERVIQQKGCLTRDANSSITEDKEYQNMMRCICDHKAAVRFTDLLEVAYSKHFLFHVGMVMMTISVTGVGAIAQLQDKSELLRLTVLSWALLFHLCCECLNAQRIIDYSEYVYNNLINLNWYDTSLRTKKLILFMMMKIQAPCILTAGGMFVLSMETYATLVKTTMSYFAFLRSAQ